MSTSSEGNVIGDLVVREWDANGRLNAPIAANEDVVLGSVLEKDGDEWIVCTTAANARAVALAAVDDNDEALIADGGSPIVLNRDAVAFGGLDEDDVIAALRNFNICIIEAESCETVS